jgi:hypothetical protein
MVKLAGIHVHRKESPTRCAASVIAAMDKEVGDCFGQARDAEIYLSQPGLGQILAARALGEFGDDPDRYATPKARKNYAGTSPITVQSGKKKTVLARSEDCDQVRRLGRTCWGRGAGVSRSVWAAGFDVAIESPAEQSVALFGEPPSLYRCTSGGLLLLSASQYQMLNLRFQGCHPVKGLEFVEFSLSKALAQCIEILLESVQLRAVRRGQLIEGGQRRREEVQQPSRSRSACRCRSQISV